MFFSFEFLHAAKIRTIFCSYVFISHICIFSALIYIQYDVTHKPTCKCYAIIYLCYFSAWLLITIF
jgi:hypothetical protein